MYNYRHAFIFHRSIHKAADGVLDGTTVAYGKVYG